MVYNSTDMELIPIWYQYTGVLVFGLIVGSFLNVVIYRLHTGRSLSGTSHCLSCGVALRWFELFPLLSYVFLGGRCRSCGCVIPPRYFLVELASALLTLLIYIQLSFSVSAFLFWFLSSVLLVIFVYDINHMIIPDELVLLAAGLAGLYFIADHFDAFTVVVVLPHVFASLVTFAFYGGLWLVSKGRWIGLGDAKLSVPLSFILGASATFSFVVFSFWIGAVLSLLIMFYPALRNWYESVKCILRTCPQEHIVKSRRYFTMKSEVPFAPFMIIAFWVVSLLNVNILEWMGSVV